MNMSLNHINFVVKMGFVFREVGIEFCTEFKRISRFNGHVVATSLSPQIPRFDTRPVQLGFVVPEVALGLRFSPVTIIPLLLHTNLCPYATPTWRTQTKHGNLQKAMPFQTSCSIRFESTFNFWGDLNGINMLTIKSDALYYGPNWKPWSPCRLWSSSRWMQTFSHNRNAAIVFCIMAMQVVYSFRTLGNADPVTKCPIPEDLSPQVVSYKVTSHHSSFVSCQWLDSS